MEDRAGLLRTYGLREIVNGAGILAAKDPTPWIWARIAGDALDIATVATGLGDHNPKKDNVLLALAALTGATAADVICSRRLSQAQRTTLGPRGGGAEATRIEASLTIEKPAEELYRRWSEPETLSKVMGHFAEIQASGDGRAHWQVRGPFGRALEWDMRTVEERPGEVLRWQALPGSHLPVEGSVRFRPAAADRGTVATLCFQFDPPGGVLGDTALKGLGGAPRLIASKALRRFKNLVETGEIPTTERQPAGRADTH
ncbi:MAG: SRPBCC family protein [Verrucomicrobia bacterium]|nr:SRPBCC family protein [Verrucomicrobiota bacterium]